MVIIIIIIDSFCSHKTITIFSWFSMRREIDIRGKMLHAWLPESMIMTAVKEKNCRLKWIFSSSFLQKNYFFTQKKAWKWGRKLLEMRKVSQGNLSSLCFSYSWDYASFFFASDVIFDIRHARLQLEGDPFITFFCYATWLSQATHLSYLSPNNGRSEKKKGKVNVSERGEEDYQVSVEKETTS
jgi:hypothetical protein